MKDAVVDCIVVFVFVADCRVVASTGNLDVGRLGDAVYPGESCFSSRPGDWSWGKNGVWLSHAVVAIVI